jgi:hypothetical protein
MMRRVFALALGLVVAACGGDASGPNVEDPYAAAAGTFTLTTANGQLPYVFFQNSAGRAEIYGGSMVLRQDRSYTETLNARAVFNTGAPPTNSNNVESGTYTIVGSQVTWTVPPSGADAGFSYTGALSGRTLTYTYDGIAYVFTKN